MLSVIYVSRIYAKSHVVGIGNARLYGLEEELGLVGDQYQIAVSILFVTYCVSCGLIESLFGEPMSNLAFSCSRLRPILLSRSYSPPDTLQALSSFGESLPSSQVSLTTLAPWSHAVFSWAFLKLVSFLESCYT